MAGSRHNQHLPTRPPMLSHQSSSVPSTPHQHARDTFISRSRSPSPHASLGGSHSPRSTKSESYMAALPRGRPTCKYETAAAFGRRRILYDIGDAPLEKAKEEPKASLNPDEEDKLSGDMRELYDRLLPTAESEQRRLKLVDKLERILKKEWPGNEFTVHVFGSSGNLLCTSESDVDICVQTPFKKLETMHQLAEVMANNGMEKVICIASAKVPIVKIWDPELKLNCDINVNNTLALENTRMIKTYVQIDDRVRQLAMIIKHWAKQRVLNDAGLGGTLSSYTWICMILNFLQTRDPPILPALHQREHERYVANDGSEAGFNDNLDELRGFGKDNKETPAQLLFQFFRRYGHEIDYEKSVISVRHGKLLLRSEKSWDSAKEALSRLCVEEPFNTTRNLGNTADATAFRGIHLEIRQAFDHLADAAPLDKLCEPFEFPPEEKNLFKRPTPGARPIMPQMPPNMRRNAPAPDSEVPRATEDRQAARHLRICDLNMVTHSNIQSLTMRSNNCGKGF
ncbi:hypothetical protein NA57DRAFT_65017 [Rhizodiscina lignyota]|uniref:polynucleotide adenylyltransferase n=1 Tax=Rhizodiscina lignyota TaxID=1504668 RepID=A0A9P4IJM8_9PEZI|nr:hypothetical protein NA57DRAFT_65017 [Rhizodiscina lignyota]